MTMPAVSVIIPTYNRATLLPRAIASVLNQTFHDLELIVVDDASADETESYVRSLGDPRVRYVRHESNRGVSAARNTGVTHAKGRYVAFQDSDDEWLLDKLERQVAVMERQGERCGMVGCALWRFIGGPTITVRWAEEAGDPERISAAGHVAGFSAFIQTALFRRECLAAIGAFDEALQTCEDWELTLRAVGKWSFGNVPEPLVISYETPNSLSSFPDRRSFALRRILEAHREMLGSDPSVYSRLLCEIAKADFFSGRYSDARRMARKAIAVAPREPRGWALWLSSLLGTGAVLTLIAWYRRVRGRAA